MDSNNVNSDEPKETNEFFIDESRASRFGIYASGPDFYVLSLRQKRAADYMASQTTEEEPKPQPEGPVCPSCGNAITTEMKFCPECGTQLSKNEKP